MRKFHLVLRARRKAISEHACREFSIEHSAKAFLYAIWNVSGLRIEGEGAMS